MKKRIYRALPTFIFGNTVTSLSKVFNPKASYVNTEVPRHIGTEYIIIEDLERSIEERKLQRGDKVEFVNHNDIKLMRFVGLRRNKFIFAEENPFTQMPIEHNMDQLSKGGFTPRAIIRPVLNSEYIKQVF